MYMYNVCVYLFVFVVYRYTLILLSLRGCSWRLRHSLIKERKTEETVTKIDKFLLRYREWMTMKYFMFFLVRLMSITLIHLIVS